LVRDLEVSFDLADGGGRPLVLDGKEMPAPVRLDPKREVSSSPVVDRNILGALLRQNATDPLHLLIRAALAEIRPQNKDDLVATHDCLLSWAADP
jgi:hypothetical protein